MAIQPMSSEPVVETYLDPDGRPDTINEDWESGPVALEDTSLGLQNQAWHLTFAGGTFTLTPEDTGLPVDVLTGQDSVQCTFTFDQSGRPTIAWEDSADRAYLYWYDSTQGQFVIYQFELTPIWGIALTLDDKRERQAGNSDIQLWYTLPHPTVSGQFILYCRYQRDRYDTPYERANPAWPYIQKCGMNEGLRVQLSLSTEAPGGGVTPPTPVTADVWVAPPPLGDDANAGTEEAPLATLAAAQTAVRALPSGNAITVMLRGGAYQQITSLALTALDSGEAGKPVTWKSYPNETARVTGSQALDPAWFSVADAGDPAWARIPAAAQGNVMVCDLGANGISDYGTLLSRGFGISDRLAALELFADDEPIELARWPKDGVNDPVYTQTDDYIEVYPTGTGSADSQDALGGYTVSGTINGENVWTKDEQIDGTDYYFYLYSSGGNNYWTISDTVGAYGTGRVWRGKNNAAFSGSMDYVGPEYDVVSTVNVAPIEGGFAPVDTVPTTTSFTVAGQVAERMDGWTTETEAWLHGFFKYHYADARLAVTDINTTTDTITMSGEPDQGMDDSGQFYIYNLLEELTQAGEYYLERSTGRLYYWPDGDISTQDLQVSMLEAPAITLAGASNITFDGLEMSATRDQLITMDATSSNITIENGKLLNAGNTAVHLDGADNKILGNEIGNPGDSGIRINGGGTTATITPSGHVIDNNEIHHFGRWTYAYQPAVRIQGGCGHQITHNTMHSAPHAAIQIIGSEHVIEYNDIHSCVQKCSDMGAIYAYLTWALQGISISYNYVHDMVSDFTGLGVHGIYMDGAASGATIYANYVVDVENRGIFIQSGLQQDVQSNILVRCDEAGYLSNEGGRSFINEANANTLLGTLNANNYQSEPWLSAYPQAATIPNNTADILDDAQNWRVPKDSIFSRNLGWDNVEFLSVADPSYLNVYAEVANNVEDSDPLFVNEAGGNLNMQAGSPYFAIAGNPQTNWFDDIGIQP